MLKRDGDVEGVLNNLRDRIAQERKTLRARLGQPPSRKRGSKSERSKLREIFRQYEGLSDQ